MIARDIENNLRYGLIRGHFAMNDCRYNVFERMVEYNVDASISNQNVNTPIVGFSQIEISNQCVCRE